MNLGENIKKLRRDRSITQEELAEYIGVTSQAVSGWETGRNAPDISLLPILAGIFDISVDELLGVDVTKKEAEIEKILKAASDKFNDGYNDEALSVVRDGLAAYPNSYKLMNLTAGYLFMRGEFDEAARLCETVMAKCTDVSVSADALDLRCTIYRKQGQRDKAIELAMKLPEFGRDKPLVWLYEGDKRAEFLKETVLDKTSYHIMLLGILAECEDDNGKPIYTPDEQIEIQKKRIALNELLYEDGDYNFFAQDSYFAYSSIAELYADKKDAENTLANLRKAAEFAEMFCTYPEDAVQTSLLFRGIKYGGWVKDAPDEGRPSFVIDAINAMENHERYGFLRENPKFTDILERFKSL